MNQYLFQRLPHKQQFLISIGGVSVVCGVGLSIYAFVDRVTAFLLLVMVSILAMFLDIVNFDPRSGKFPRRIVPRIKLTVAEHALLVVLAHNEDKVLTHLYLLKHVWGAAHQNESQYLHVFIAQLRKKIETDHNRPTFIITESGIGYRFVGTMKFSPPVYGTTK